MTVVFNLWAFPMISMIPVIGEESFRLGPSAVGILASTEGGRRIDPGRRLRAPRQLHAALFAGCVFYLVFSIAFAASPFPWLAGAMLFVVGLGGAAYAAMQTTLVILSAPAEVRGRMMGVLVRVASAPGRSASTTSGCSRTGSAARNAVALIGLEGLVAAIGISLAWPEYPPAPKAGRERRRRTGRTTSPGLRFARRGKAIMPAWPARKHR